MVIVWVVVQILFIAGVIDLIRISWHRAEESVFDSDIAAALRNGNQKLADVCTENRRRWLAAHPTPSISWLGWPMMAVVIALLVVAAIIIALALHIGEVCSNVKAELFAGPYRQVR